MIPPAPSRLGWLTALAGPHRRGACRLSIGVPLRNRSSIFIAALAVVGLNLLMGFAGQVSLGHAGFWGLGAYAVAVGPTHLGIPPLVSLLAGLLLTMLIAWLVGRPILRLRGHYLAVATLGFGFLVSYGADQRGALDRWA